METTDTSQGGTGKALMGCGCLMLLPAALFVLLGYAVYQYYLMQDPNYRPEENAAPEDPGTPNGAPELPSGLPAFSDQEEAEIQRLFQNLNSPDYQVTSSAWNRLAPYMKKNGPLFRDRLVEAMNRNSSRLFVVQAAWGLCVYYGEEGRLAVIRLAVSHKEDPNILYAIDDALRTLGKNERTEMRNRVRQALENVRSPYADRFSR